MQWTGSPAEANRCISRLNRPRSAAAFVRFLPRLLGHGQQKVLPIVDEHPVHEAAAVERWVAGRRQRLRLFFLPGYSPDLDPDGFLDQDVKTNAVGRQRPRD